MAFGVAAADQFVALGEHGLQPGLGLYHIGPGHQARGMLVAHELQRALGRGNGTLQQHQPSLGQAHAPVGLDQADLGLQFGRLAVGLGSFEGCPAALDLGRYTPPQVRCPADGGAGLHAVGHPQPTRHAGQTGHATAARGAGRGGSAARHGAAQAAAGTAAGLGALAGTPGIGGDLRQPRGTGTGQHGTGLPDTGLGLGQGQVAALLARQQVGQYRVIEGCAVEQRDGGQRRGDLAGIGSRLTSATLSALALTGVALTVAPGIRTTRAVLTGCGLPGRRHQVPACILFQRGIQVGFGLLVGGNHIAAAENQGNAGGQQGTAKQRSHDGLE